MPSSRGVAVLSTLLHNAYMLLTFQGLAIAFDHGVRLRYVLSKHGQIRADPPHKEAFLYRTDGLMNRKTCPYVLMYTHQRRMLI